MKSSEMIKVSHNFNSDHACNHSLQARNRKQGKISH
jgi:hypothetical protein